MREVSRTLPVLSQSAQTELRKLLVVGEFKQEILMNVNPATVGFRLTDPLRISERFLPRKRQVSNSAHITQQVEDASARIQHLFGLRDKKIMKPSFDSTFSEERFDISIDQQICKISDMIKTENDHLDKMSKSIINVI